MTLLNPNPSQAALDTIKSIDDIKQASIEGIHFLNNQQLKTRINQNPKLVLLDVRTEKEYEAGHLLGASWVERGIAEFVLARTLPDKQSEIIVYCKKGYRSALVVKALRGIGYTNVHAHMGFDEWVLEGNHYMNYLGESRLIHPKTINAANFKPDYYQTKK